MGIATTALVLVGSPFTAVEVRLHAPDARPLPTVLLFHGLGATPEDIAELYSGYPHPLRVVAVRGPAAWGDGFAWYDFAGSNLFPGDAETEMRQRAEELAAFVDVLEAQSPGAGSPLAVGFSQGGMTAFLLAARHPELVAGAVPIAGRLPVALVPDRIAPVVPVRALHGNADTRIPVDDDDATAAAFRAHGGDATLERFPGVGHTISPEMRARVWSLTASLLGPAPAVGTP